VTFAQAVRLCFRKYVTFSGRASRTEFWSFAAFTWLVSACLTVIEGAIMGPTISSSLTTTWHMDGSVTTGTHSEAVYNGGPVTALWGLVVLLPLLAASWRRLHDAGRPGWYVLLPFLVMLVVLLTMFASMGAFSGDWSNPETALARLEAFGPGLFALCILGIFATFIVLLVFLCQRSQPGPNRYGPPPSEVTP
jgi:uncharacterized membrane protein YhaH (DUF805 family)